MGLLEGSRSQSIGSEGQLEVSKGQLEGLRASQRDMRGSQGNVWTDRCMDVEMDRIFPHSVVLCPYWSHCPKRRQRGRSKEIHAE